MRALAVSLLVVCTFAAHAHDGPHSNAVAAARMRQAADLLVASLSPPARGKALRPFNDAARFDWYYTPRSRNGIALRDLDETGRDAVHVLLREALSATGYRKAVNIIELERVLREIETPGVVRDPERYHLTFYGRPDPVRPWGWRFEGHNLSLNFTLAGERVVVDTPSFFGANPAQVMSGPRAGLRVLAAEEDEARALLGMLSDKQRRVAIFDSRTYGDIVTSNAGKVDPLAPVGIAATTLDKQQRAQLQKLIEVYARNFEPSLAEARLARVQDGGVDKIRFGWAGATERGRPHYYRVQGPLFLIEYDASQDDGNQVHTVWRDFTGDFGRDLLREHYAPTQGTSQRHAGPATLAGAAQR